MVSPPKSNNRKVGWTLVGVGWRWVRVGRTKKANRSIMYNEKVTQNWLPENDQGKNVLQRRKHNAGGRN